MIAAIKDFKNFVGKEVTVQGWMFNKRSSGKLAFLEVRDGSGETQHPRFQDQYEIHMKQIRIIQNPSEEYSIGKKEHGPDFLLERMKTHNLKESGFGIGLAHVQESIPFPRLMNRIKP